MAREDAKRTVASDLATVKDAAEFLGVTPQAVHKMMTDGRLRYVETPGLRLPIRKGLEAAKKRAGRLAKPQGPRVRTRVGSSTRGSAASRKKRIVA
jgi:predicted site-specific integrase-resolvase